MKAHLVVALSVLLAPATASAYVDPGSGMVVWQGLLALVGAALVFFRSPRESIRRMIERFRKKK